MFSLNYIPVEITGMVVNGNSFIASKQRVKRAKKVQG